MTRFRVALWVFVIWWVLWPPLVQAEIPEIYQGRPIVAVDVLGESASLVQPEDLSLPKGSLLTRQVLREYARALLASGRWVDVQIDVAPGQGGVRLQVALRPKLFVSRIEVRGQAVLKSGEILDAIRVAPGAPMSEGELADVAGQVQQLYAARGYGQAKVQATFRATDNPARKVLMLVVEEGAPTRITEVRFAGDQPPMRSRVLAQMGVSPGEILDRRSLERGLAEGATFLRRKRYLEAEFGVPVLQVAGGQARLTIPSRVGPRYSLRIAGHEPLSHQAVREVLALAERPLSAAAVRYGLTERLRDLYARHGMPSALVRVWRLRGRKPGTAVLQIHIDPGKPLRVVNIEFPGAHLLDSELLRDQVYSYLEEDLPNTGLIQPVDPVVVDRMGKGREPDEPRRIPIPLRKDARTTFYETTYEQAIAHIRHLGQAEGFLSINVGPVRLREVGERQAVVEIPVVEGPRTRLHGVQVVGAERLTTRDVLLASGLTRSQPFSYVALEEARLRVISAYQDRGYFFARVEPVVRFSADRTRAEVIFSISERFPVHIGEVVIRGAERTSHSYIRGVLKLSRGDLYRPALVKESEGALQTLGVFSALSVRLEQPEQPARVKTLLVEVTERASQYLDVTAGVSTGQGVRGGFEYGYRNLFGYAVELALRVQLAHQLFFVDNELERQFKDLTSLDQRLERRISLGLIVPRTPGLEEVRTAVDLVHLRNNERDFGIDSNGLGVTFTFRPLREVTVALGTDLENNQVQLFNDESLELYLTRDDLDLRLRRLLRVPEGNTTLAGLRGTISWDRRDSPFTPTKGTFLSLAGEVAQTLKRNSGTDDLSGAFYSRFLKLTLGGSGYIPLAAGVVLAGQARVGRVFHLQDGSRTYPNRAYFMGGVDTIRGYFQDAMVPQELVDQMKVDPNLLPTQVTRAGDAFALLRGEVRFPLFGQLRGGLFVDMGNLWADGENLDPFHLRPSAGAGLRLATPVGPVALDYGVLLLRRRVAQEPFGALHFSIGLF